MKKRHLLAAIFAASLAPSIIAADAPPLTPEEILKKVTYPTADFDATVFASPPNVAYPIYVSAAPDGTLFVGCDANGSLDRKPDRGKVVMCKDTDGDGKADKFTTFCRVDSPRGVAWDQSTRTLYVMHPPNLTACHDDNGDGVSDRQEDLIIGLGFGLDKTGSPAAKTIGELRDEKWHTLFSLCSIPHRLESLCHIFPLPRTGVGATGEK